MNAVTGTGCTSVGIGVNANLELVGKFFYFPFCDDVIFHIITSSLGLDIEVLCRSIFTTLFLVFLVDFFVITTVLSLMCTQALQR